MNKTYDLCKNIELVIKNNVLLPQVDNSDNSIFSALVLSLIQFFCVSKYSNNSSKDSYMKILESESVYLSQKLLDSPRGGATETAG